MEGRDDHCEKWSTVYDDQELAEHEDLAGGIQADRVAGMTVSPDGSRVFTFGISSYTPGVGPDGADVNRRERLAVVATNGSTGDQIWVVHPAEGDILSGIAVSADGSRVYVVGTRNESAFLAKSNALIVAYKAATGELLWERMFDGAPIGHVEGEEYKLHTLDEGLAVRASSTGDRVYLSGYSDSRDSFFDMLAVSYDGSSGAMRWARRHDSSTPQSRFVEDQALPGLLETSADGKRLFLVGRSCPETGPCTYRVLGFQAHDPSAPANDGNLLWVRDLGPAAQPPESLTMAPDGKRFYLVLEREAGSPVLAAFDAGTGNELWGHEVPTGLVSLTASSSGDRVFASIGDRTLAFQGASGQELWAATYAAGTPDFARSSDVSADGSVIYVTGHASVDPGDPSVPGVRAATTGEQATVAYSASTGTLIWVARYQHAPLALHDSPFFLEVGSNGTVFTSSWVRYLRGSGSAGSDWAVVAYDPVGA